MTIIYAKSLLNDFSNILDTNELFAQIDASSIEPSIVTIQNIGDVVNIIFESSLSVDEEALLDSLIENHDPVYQGNIIDNITVPNTLLNTLTWTTLSSFSFPGTNLWTNITNIKVISFMAELGISYEIQIYDVTNNALICHQTLDNVEYKINDLGTISNLPKHEAVFEVLGKVSGLTIAYIKNINIYHD